MPGPDRERLRRRAAWNRLFVIAMELPFILVGTVLLGGLFGYLLDSWLGTAPAFLVSLGFLGFIGGLREMLRRLRQIERQSTARDRQHDGTHEPKAPGNA